MSLLSADIFAANSMGLSSFKFLLWARIINGFWNSQNYCTTERQLVHHYFYTQMSKHTLPGTRSLRSTIGPWPGCHFSCSTWSAVPALIASMLSSTCSSLAFSFTALSKVFCWTELFRKLLEKSVWKSGLGLVEVGLWGTPDLTAEVLWSVGRGGLL